MSRLPPLEPPALTLNALVLERRTGYGLTPRPTPSTDEAVTSSEINPPGLPKTNK